MSLRSACDIRRACRPICASPISPSISARGTSAATESTTTTSTPFERMRTSAISSACSPLSGCETSRLSRSTPSFCAYCASSACSASMKAATPPRFCACAIACSASVVLPDDSGPKISMTRPRGRPPTPSAQSRLIDPVEIAGIGAMASLPPSRMIEPLPNCFSICPTASSTAFARSLSTRSSRSDSSIFSILSIFSNFSIFSVRSGAAMGLLAGAPPKGATATGAKVILGTCHDEVKRKSCRMCLYPLRKQWLSTACHFRLVRRGCRKCDSAPARYSRFCSDW